MPENIHRISITGMTCGGCSQRVTRVLESTEGVLSAEISHETNSGMIRTDDSLSIQALVDIVNSTGFNASQ
jgi:copper chaperone CopZ